MAAPIHSNLFKVRQKKGRPDSQCFEERKLEHSFSMQDCEDDHEVRGYVNKTNYDNTFKLTDPNVLNQKARIIQSKSGNGKVMKQTNSGLDP